MSRHERPRFGGRGKAVLLAALTSAVLAAAIAFAVRPSAAVHRDNGLSDAAQGAQADSHARGGTAAPLRVLSISPGESADPVTAANPVRVVFSAALAPSSPLPTFSPAVRGRWHAAGGSTLVFTPSAPLRPVTELTLRVPGGASGVRSAAGARLGSAATAVFQVGGWSTLRLEQLLAQLGYLPLAWTPGRGSGVGGQPGGGTVTVSYARPGRADGAPAAGTFTWQGSYPSALTSLWQPGRPNVILAGAIMAFQADHGLPPTGAAGRLLWRVLLTAVARGERNPHGYTYALASKTSPETMTVWHDGYVVQHGLASTGGAATPTPDGTFPVYLRRRAQVMRGLQPNGARYADPVQFVSYFSGDYAVHSMNRRAFGFPQSLGCVELPLSEARQVWPYLSYGSLVTVAG